MTKKIKGLGYSPLTEKVYYGTQNVDKRMWIGTKIDVTQTFLSVCDSYFTINTMRKVNCGNDSSFYLHIKNDNESIERTIKTLSNLLKKQDENKIV